MPPDRFSVRCPGCHDRKRHLTTRADWIEHSCRCGTTFIIDTDEQAVEEVLSE